MNSKDFKIIVLTAFSFLSVYAQDYCEPPVRGVYTSGPELKDIFSFQSAELPVLVEDDFLLDPGKQAGQFFLNMTVEDVQAKLPLGVGKTKANPISKQSNLYYESYAQGLGFYFDQEKLVLIEVNNEDYKTREGLALGSSQQKLQDIKGCQITTKQQLCPGINFVLFEDAVKTIHIFTKND